MGMILPNCPEYVIAFFACQRIGAVAVGNNPLYTERELEHQIKDSGATVMIVLDQIYHRFGEIRDVAGVKDVIAVKLNHYMAAPIKWLAPLKFKSDAKKHGTPMPFIPAGHQVRWWADLMKQAGPVPPEATIADPDTEVAALVYTGGTTGSVQGRDALALEPGGERPTGLGVAQRRSPGRGRHRGGAAVLPLVRHAGDGLLDDEGRQAGAAARASRSTWR